MHEPCCYMKSIHLHFIIACCIFSFLFSLLLLSGPIEDFFVFYHAGRVVAQGGEIYRDLADDKGPVTYIFFSFLYRIFGSYYNWAIIFASTVLDALLCIFSFFILQKWTGFSLPKEAMWQYVLSFTLVGYIKSFSIGTVAAGVYSEQIAMVFLLVSFLLIQKKHIFTSGFVFALAIFSRQSIIFFLIIPILLLFPKKRNVLFFLCGVLLLTVIFLLYWWQKGLLFPVWEMMVQSVGKYRAATLPYRLSNITTTLFVQIRILFSIIFVGVFSIRVFQSLKQRGKHIFFFCLLITSALSVFAGAEVWGHHFLQWSPLLLFCFFWIHTYFRTDRIFQLLGAIVFVSVVASYVGYIAIGAISGASLSQKWPIPREIAQKKYLVTVPFFDQLYVDYQKESPDRYLHSDFWMNDRRYGSWAKHVVSEHEALSEKRLQDTAFVFLSRDNSTNQYQWYLDTFADRFHLVKQTTYDINSMRMEIYFSAL